MFVDQVESKLSSRFAGASKVRRSYVYTCSELVYAFVSISRARLQQRHHKAILVLGKRYGGVEACTAGIVDAVCLPAELRDSAITTACRLAGSQGLDRRTLSTLKHDLYRDVVQSLSEPPRFYSLL